MKKIVLSLLMLVGSSSIFSQAVSTGNFILDAYYGGPNFEKNLYQSIEEAVGTQNFSASGIGPAGLRGEYMIGETFGLGFDVIYNSNSYTYFQVDSFNTDIVNSYERSMNRLRIQMRFNFHFDVTNPNLDAYFGVAAGTNMRYKKYYVNGSESINDNFSLKTLIPFSMRVCSGVRYYFNQYIGLNAEIGLGGPLVSAGLSVRF